jgi:hypothetical protein
MKSDTASLAPNAGDKVLTTGICRGADKSLAFLFPIFLFAAQPKEIFLDGLKKLEQQSHKCVELRDNM